jgi:hypothetical protein
MQWRKKLFGGGGGGGGLPQTDNRENISRPENWEPLQLLAS